MISFVIAATIVLSLAACAELLLRDRDRVTQRMVLLAGMTTTLLLPLVTKLTSLTGLVPPVDVDRLGSVASGWTYNSNGTGFLGVWIVGAALMTARLGWHAYLALRLARRSRTLSANESAAVSKTLALEIDEVARRFRIVDGIDTPLVLAGLRQTVLLPTTWSRWPAELRASALRHEWQHVRDADAQWAVLAALLRVGLWFHPLAWWVCARWAEQCEHLADRAAAMDRVAADYAQELLSLAKTTCSNGLEFATAFIPHTRSRLERRVRAVLEDSSYGLPCGRVIRLMVVLAFAVAGLSLATMLAPPREQATGAIETDAQTRMMANPFPADP